MAKRYCQTLLKCTQDQTLLLDRDQCYDLLGLKNNASVHEIRSAYRRLALECHPDKDTIFKDGIKFKMITEAYQTLRMNNTHTGKAFHSVYWNETSHVPIHKKIQSWDFYFDMFDNMVQNTRKIRLVKAVCCNLTTYVSFVKNYGLMLKRYVMRISHMVMPFCRSVYSFISPMSYEKMSRVLLKHLGLHS